MFYLRYQLGYLCTVIIAGASLETFVVDKSDIRAILAFIIFIDLLVGMFHTFSRHNLKYVIYRTFSCIMLMLVVKYGLGGLNVANESWYKPYCKSLCITLISIVIIVICIRVLMRFIEKRIFVKMVNGDIIVGFDNAFADFVVVNKMIMHGKRIWNRLKISDTLWETKQSMLREKKRLNEFLEQLRSSMALDIHNL